MGELLKKKGVRIALLIIILIVIAGIAGINAQSAQRQKEYNGHIDAAEKYLSELDYEQAIAEYALALEIEPKSEEALGGLEQTYLAYAKSYADAGDYERAVEILEEGYAMTERESLKEKIEEYREQKEAETAQSGEIGQIVESDEFQEKIRKLSAGYGRLRYMTDEQLRELCWPLIEVLEQYRALYPEKWKYYVFLPDLYFQAGEYELCAQLRKELHEMFPDATVFSSSYYSEEEFYAQERDEYGRSIRDSFLAANDVFEYEYGENGRLLVEFNTWERRTKTDEYEYDSEGRVSKITSFTECPSGEDEGNFILGYTSTDVSTYEYSEGGFTVYDNCEIRSDDGSYSVREWATDYAIDEYGGIEKIGEH